MTDATMDQGSTRRHWGGLILGAMLLGVLIWRLPWAEALVTLREVRLAWWVPALVLGAFGVWFRALRLHLVLGVPRPLLCVWRAVALGYLAGLVLPAGGGEVVKIRTLMKARDLDILHAGSAVTLDRLFDLLGLVLGLALLAGLQALPGPVGTLLGVLSVALVTTGVFLVLLITQGQATFLRLSLALTRLTWLATKVQRMGTLVGEAEHLRGARTWLRLVLFQLFITAFEVVVACIALRVLPVTAPMPPWAGLQVLMFGSIGFALPLLPGAAGSLQVAYILALTPFGVPLPQALGFSLLGHLGHLLVVLGHGLPALLLPRLSSRSGTAGQL